ncbi:MAG: hypothetical protein WC445_01090 [Patescibacteria group bacterium]
MQRSNNENYIGPTGKVKCQEIQLKGGAKVIVNWSSKTKCKCGAEFWWACTKNHKMIPIVLVGHCEWAAHFADCPLAGKFRKNK